MGFNPLGSQSSNPSNPPPTNVPAPAIQPPNPPGPSPQASSPGQGCTPLLICTVLFLICVIIFFVFPSNPIASAIANTATVVAVLLTIIQWLSPDANQVVNKWFAGSDALLIRLWQRLTGFRGVRLSPATLRLSLVIIILLGALISTIFYPFLPTGIHNIISPSVPTPAMPKPSIYVDPQTGIGITQGDYDFLQGNALDSSPTNAEKLIYNLNLNIKSGSNYATMVVVAPLDQQGRNFGIGYDTLQAAYVLQQEANAIDSCKFSSPAGCIRIRLLIANAGDNLEAAPTVAQQIIQIASDNQSRLIGCFGFPLSTPGNIEGVRLLTAKNIPVISSSASSDALTAISPYFFRVAPVDSEQGLVATQYIENQFHNNIHNILVLYASGNPYSLTLATAVMSSFSRQPNNRVLSYTYDPNGDVDSQIHMDLSKAFNGSGSPPDLVYFAGYAVNFNKLLTQLRNNTEFQKYSTVPIFSGDSAYDLTEYTGSNYQNIFFTSFASPDEWGNFPDPCKMEQSLPPYHLFCDYAKDFDPSHQHPGIYGQSRTDSTVMVVYDAATVLIQGYLAAYHSSQQPTEGEIQQAIQGFNVCHPLQGVSGLIGFGPDNNPFDKAIVLLKVSDTGYTTFLPPVQGQIQAPTLQGC